MSRRRPAVAAPLLVIAVAFAALWADAPAAIAADAGAVIVTITDRLDLAAIDVAPGTVVVWRNDDSGRHRVRAREAPTRFDSGNLEPGDTFSIALADEGVYAYVDERNEGDPRYAGRITVSSSAGGQAPPPTSTPGTPTPDVPPPPASTEAPSTRAVDVAILDRSFSPASVSVATGGTVAWTNTSDRDHTVSFSDDLPGSDVLPAGGTFRQTFTTPGSFSYICAIHPEMTGTVTVSGSPAGDTGATAAQGLTVASLAGDGAPSTASTPVLPRWVVPAGVAAVLFAIGAPRLRRRRRGRAS